MCSCFYCAKQAVKAVQALSVMDSSRPCELDVHGTEDGYGWGLWQQLTRHTNLLDSGYNFGKEQRSHTP